MTDAINPSHYKSHESGVEAIEICQHLDFSLGNAIKYLWRVGKKHGVHTILEDLQKSAWYLHHAFEMKSIGFGFRRSYLVVPALTRVINSEAEGSVLRDVLQYVAVQALDGCEPRIADALLRVERAIEEASR